MGREIIRLVGSEFLTADKNTEFTLSPVFIRKSGFVIPVFITLRINLNSTAGGIRSRGTAFVARGFAGEEGAGKNGNKQNGCDESAKIFSEHKNTAFFLVIVTKRPSIKNVFQSTRAFTPLYPPVSWND